MTANEIISIAFGLMGEKTEDFPDKSLAVGWLNSAIAGCTDRENLIREKKGLSFTESPAVVKTMADRVDMDQSLCRDCMPYAVAALLAVHRENDYLYSVYMVRFAQGLTRAAKGLEKPVEDFYKGGV